MTGKTLKETYERTKLYISYPCTIYLVPITPSTTAYAKYLFFNTSYGVYLRKLPL
jgi:hypothetical protein